MSCSYSLSSLRVVQWNACGIRSKLPELTKNSADFDIVVISETLLRKKKICNLRGFNCVRQNRQKKQGGGVCIYIRNNIKYCQSPVSFDGNGRIEACAIKVFTIEGPLIIASVYRPPNVSSLSTLEWSQFFNQFPYKTIFCGDFNAHHRLWGDSKCCSVGCKIKDAVDDSDYIILNDQKATYHSSTHNSWSSIDLIIAHTSLGLYTDWKVCKDNWGSDHFPIFLHIGRQITPSRPLFNSNRKYSKNIDWKKFKDRVSMSIEKNKSFLTEISDLDVKYTSFVAIISDALSPKPPKSNPDNNNLNIINNAQSKPRNTTRQKNPTPDGNISDQSSFHSSPPCIWWDAECDRLVRLRKAVLSKFRFSNLRSDFIEYKKASAKARITFKKKKRDNFIEFCENLRKDTNPSYIWRKIKAFKNRWDGNGHSYTLKRLSKLFLNL